jgi:hypothetical protein
VSASSHERATTTALDEVFDLDSLPLRDDAPPAVSTPKTHRARAVLPAVAVLMLAMLGGLASWTNRASIRSIVETSFGRSAARIATTPARPPAPAEPGLLHHDEPVVSSGSDAVALAGDLPPVDAGPQTAATDRASILIFTPRPGSIAAGGPTRLCYAVSEALHVRLEPGIGEVSPARTLTCLRVAPARTTTYELTASGRNGYQVRQQLVIVVR